MTRNALYLQSGGPTAVINASAYGVIEACMQHPYHIGTLYGARHGIVGLLNNHLINLRTVDQAQLPLLKQTPSMAFGSCRYRMPDAAIDDTDYQKALQTLRAHDIGYLFFNGGNGTLSAALKMHQYIEQHQYDCKVIVIPKTVDNDIACIDHAPGFPSTARHVAITVSELAHDTRSYNTGLITVVEVMGRDSGWVAAATMAAGQSDAANAPDLIYVPEVNFSTDAFIRDVKETYARKGRCLAVVAEGVRDEAGKYLFEYGAEEIENPDLNMGGTTPYLTWILRKHFDCKVRGVDLGLMQRCASHNTSELDVQEAVHLGARAVEAALSGISGKMVSIRRIANHPYQTEDTLEDIASAAGGNPLPASYIAPSGNAISSSFRDYLEPLIGTLPEYARLNII